MVLWRRSAARITVPMGFGPFAAVGVSMTRCERGCLAVLRIGRLLMGISSIRSAWIVISDASPIPAPLAPSICFCWSR